MKTFRKLLAWLLSLAAVFALAIPASAQAPVAHAALSDSQPAPEETFTCTISMDKTVVSSLGIEVVCPDALEVTAGQWLQTGLMANFDMSKTKGVFSPGGAKEMEGTLFQLTLKAVKPSAEPIPFTVRLIGKNSTQTVVDETMTLTVTVSCPGHQFGSYIPQGETHYQQCTLCSYMEVGDHTPSDWITDQEPAVGVPGSKHMECTLCGEYLEEEEIPALLPQPTYVARIGEVYYTDLEKAMDAAKADQTVTLLAFAELEHLIIHPNITLDLNGQRISVDFTMGFAGSKLIDSVGGGMLQSPYARLATDNPQMPVWDEAAGGYRFFSMKSQQKFLSQTANDFSFITRPALGSDANDGLMAQSSTNGLSFQLRLRWQTAGGNDISQLFSIKAALLNSIYSQAGNVILLTVSGTGAYAGKLVTDVYLESETGVVWNSNDLLYTGG